MTSEWHKSTSDIMPETVDTTSSKDYVLVRRNIEYVNGMYEYEEKFVDRNDWKVYEDIVQVGELTEDNTVYTEENDIAICDIADLADTNSLAIDDIAVIVDELLSRVEALEG